VDQGDRGAKSRRAGRFLTGAVQESGRKKTEEKKGNILTRRKHSKSLQRGGEGFSGGAPVHCVRVHGKGEKGLLKTGGREAVRGEGGGGGGGGGGEAYDEEPQGGVSSLKPWRPRKRTLREKAKTSYWPALTNKVRTDQGRFNRSPVHLGGGRRVTWLLLQA